MADEVTNDSNKKQLIIYLRCLDNLMNLHEEFIGLLSVHWIHANILVHVIYVGHLDILKFIDQDER